MNVEFYKKKMCRVVAVKLRANQRPHLPPLKNPGSAPCKPVDNSVRWKQLSGDKVILDALRIS